MERSRFRQSQMQEMRKHYKEEQIRLQNERKTKEQNSEEDSHKYDAAMAQMTVTLTRSELPDIKPETENKEAVHKLSVSPKIYKNVPLPGPGSYDLPTCVSSS